MIKVLANKCLAFDRNERDHAGNLIRYKTKIGFCELPDWVEQTDLYKAAVADGSLQSFVSSAESEAVVKASEQLAKLQDEIKALEEKKDLLNGGQPTKAQLKKHFKELLGAAKDDDEAKAIIAEATAAGIDISPK